MLSFLVSHATLTLCTMDDILLVLHNAMFCGNRCENNATCHVAPHRTTLRGTARERRVGYISVIYCGAYTIGPIRL